MIGNKYTQADRTSMLTKKLALIAQNLNSSAQSGSFKTQEAYASEAIKAMNQFNKGILDPQMPVNIVYPDTLPNPDDYNTIWNAMLNDLITVFTELQNIQNLTLDNFNSALPRTECWTTSGSTAPRWWSRPS